VDRLKAQQFGLTQRDVVSNVLLALSGSGQVAPNYWLDPETGVQYPVVVQNPQYRLDNLGSLARSSVTSSSATGDQVLGNVAQTTRTVSPLTVSHYDSQPVMDVYV